MAKFHYSVNGKQKVVQVEPDSDGYKVQIGDNCYQVDVQNIGKEVVSFRVDGNYRKVYWGPGDTPEARQFWFDGHQWTLEKVDPRQKRRRGGESTDSGALTASMPGQIRAVLVEIGDSVTKGTPLIVMEAMKMEMRLTAPDDGVITAINCSVDDVVERGELLVVMSAS